jgi:transposase
MANYFLYRSSDDEKRKLRVDIGRLEYRLKYQKHKREEAEDETKAWREKYKEQQKQTGKLKEELEKLKEENDKLRKQRDTYRSMLFKRNKRPLTEKADIDTIISSQSKKRIGGQLGHKGYGRKLAIRIDNTLRVFASVCPDCKGELSRTEAIVTHTVEDIPAPKTIKTIVTQYEVERQWCKNCKKEITVTPVGVIPNSKLGINVIVQILIWKYVCRMPMAVIVSLLESTYKLTMSTGTVALFLRRTSEYLKKPYSQILKEVRAAPVKHADETGWRVNGQNEWCWAFLTKEAVYYTIEESRGKAIAEKVLKNCHKKDVLVRDDYPGYKKLNLTHQSCWAHLLRESHKEISQKGASTEVKQLHMTLKLMYQKLKQTVESPYNKKERNNIHNEQLQKLNEIIQTTYHNEDVKRVQYRIKQQGKNLLTALLHNDVPLTNNLAERAIRPLVVTRKISGGSRTRKGAKVHMINMSVIQTMKMKKQSLHASLQDYFFPVVGNN